MSTEKMYDSDRIQLMSRVMPEFHKSVKAGDTLLMGIQSDKLFPYADAERPVAKVQSVHSSGLGVDVGGEYKFLSTTDLHPKNVYELTPETFENVLQRSLEQSAAEKSGVDTSTASTAQSANANANANVQVQLENVRSELQQLRSAQQSVNKDLVRALYRTCKDISSNQTKFSKSFSKQYAANMDNMSDYSSESSESSESSRSTEGNESDDMSVASSAFDAKALLD